MHKLWTSLVFLPRTVADPPSPLRALAYVEGGAIPDPEAVTIAGTLSNVYQVGVQYGE